MTPTHRDRSASRLVNGDYTTPGSAASSGSEPRVWRAHLSNLLLAGLVLTATMVGVDGEEAVVLVPPNSLVECLIFVTAAAVYASRSFPLAALVVTAVLDALPFWLPIGGAGYHLGLMIAVYVMVAHRPRRHAVPAVSTVFVAQVCLMAWDMNWRWFSMYVAIAALTVAFPAALGAASRARALTTEALRQRTIAAEQSRDANARQLMAEDRLRTARDLHDSVAHQIAVMNLNAGIASESLPDRPMDAQTALDTIREAGQSVIHSISELLTGLRNSDWEDPQPLQDFADLQLLVDEFHMLTPDLKVSFEGCAAGTTRTVHPVLVSVVREALTNSYKHGLHGEPMVFTIHLDRTSSTVTAMNTSRHRTPSTIEGFGLTGMRERLTTIGGHLDIERTDATFILRAHLPVLEEQP